MDELIPAAEPHDETLEEASRLLRELEKRKRESPISFYNPSEKQLSFHKATQRKRFLGGGNRVGKTLAGTVEVEWFARGTHPYRNDIETPNVGWIVVLDTNVGKQVNWEKIKALFTPGECTFNEREGIITWKNGSLTYVKSCDSGEEKFQGAGLRYIWFDEEPPEQIYKESMARVAAGTRLDIWMTATLLHGLTFPYDEFIAPVQEAKKGGYENKDVFAVILGIRDNPYFSAEEIRQFASSFTGDEYKVRVEGEILQMGMDSLVSQEELKRHEETDITPPTCAGTFSGTKEMPRVEVRADGVAHIWGELEPSGKLRKPDARDRFSIGWDVSEGRGYDFSVAACYNVRTQEKVAVIRSNRIPPREMAAHVAAMAWWYNNALITPESNAVGLSAIDALKDLRVRLYSKQYLDKRTNTFSEKVGFRTSVTTRNYLIDQYISRLPELLIRDPILFEALKNFVRWPDGKYAGRSGKEDDSCFADFLAIEGTNQVPVPKVQVEKRLTDFERMLKEKKKGERHAMSAVGAGGY